MRRLVHTSALAVGIAIAAGCGGSEPGPAGPPRSGPRANVLEPQVVFQAQPDLSDADAEALWATPGTVRAVVHVKVSRDGTPSDASITSFEPKDLPIARAFAEAVVRSIPQWKFRPAARDGKPVDAELDLTMEAEGGAETPEGR